MPFKVPDFWDLIRPRLRVVLYELKVSGAMPASDLAVRLGGSYMGARKSCEDLVKAGYVRRTRNTGSGIGRPEIFFSLTKKADALFPQCGSAFTVELLDLVSQAHGERAPERLLYQYFQGLRSKHEGLAPKFKSLEKRALALFASREADGCVWQLEEAARGFARVIEYHNPLQAIFDSYPRAVQMEQAALGEIMGAKCTRYELPALQGEHARVVFEFESTGLAY